MNFITHNLRLKIFAFIAAIALWFFVVGIENTVYRFPLDIQIQATNLPQNLSLASDLGKAKLVVKAGNDDYKRLTNSDFEVYVDLKNYNAGEHVVPLSADVKNEKVTLLRVEPPTISVKLEPITTKEVKIEIITTGSPLQGYHLKENKLSEETAVVTGAQSFLQNIGSVNARLDFNGTQNQDFKVTVPLTLDNKNIPDLTIEPKQVTIDVKLEAEPQQKVVAIKPKILGETLEAAQNQLAVEPLTIMIQGPQDVLAKIEFLETEAILPTRVKGSAKSFKVNLALPPNVALGAGESRLVTITVKTIDN